MRHPCRRRPSEHSRARGEDRQSGPGISFDLGTPPHTRGRPLGRGAPAFPHRNTPAHAGKTGDLADAVGVLTGTPPRTRGRLRLAVDPGGALWNTPAHAGKTSPSSRVANASQEHPRTRGEDRPNLPLPRRIGTPPRTRGRPPQSPGISFDLGTPPHTRGRRNPIDALHHDSGNTPAHARKTAPTSGYIRFRPEHPRTRGEDPALTLRVSWFRETPPRTRGRPRRSSR